MTPEQARRNGAFARAEELAGMKMSLEQIAEWLEQGFADMDAISALNIADIAQRAIAAADVADVLLHDNVSPPVSPAPVADWIRKGQVEIGLKTSVTLPNGKRVEFFNRAQLASIEIEDFQNFLDTVRESWAEQYSELGEDFEMDYELTAIYRG